jgi:hypothetical protein
MNNFPLVIHTNIDSRCFFAEASFTIIFRSFSTCVFLTIKKRREKKQAAAQVIKGKKKRKKTILYKKIHT